MPQIAKLAPNFAVAPQITEADVADLAALGFKSVVNNRPDNEAPDQPAGAAIEAAARRAGLPYRHIPVAGQISDAQVDAFAAALADLPGPVLAFCRSGTRCSVLWALSRVGEQDPETLVQTAAEAGYDLSPLRPRLSARFRARGAGER